MYTSKRELNAALKLAAASKTQGWPAFARFKASRRGFKSPEENQGQYGESEESFARRQAFEAREAESYLGVGLMQTTCGLWESEFYFRGEWKYEEITVNLGVLETAVKTLGKGEIELIAKDSFLYIWQGRECIKIGAVVFGEEITKQLPATTLRELNRGGDLWLNVYEFSGFTRILKKILTFTGKTDLGYNYDSLYIENRARDTEGYEDLFLSTCDRRIVTAGRQIVERLGGFGIFLIPSNAARKICAAAKLLSPEGMLLRLDNYVVSFEIGRAIISCKLVEADFINPEITIPRDVIAVFNLDKAQLARFAKKAKYSLSSITFEYKDGVLAAAAGHANYEAQGVIPAGQDKRPLDNDFRFELSAEALCNILKGVTADVINIYYAGEKRPVYLTADGINYAVLPVAIEDKKEDKK
ncbi:hypothetical protein Dip510_000846 [Elusimicrobium posterum]|uniref:hypothetical protein n=1 Tax=Elusimicrobium posterum TaxID=3116653 RepID=UPI003C72940E